MTGLTDPDLLPFGTLPDFGDVQQYFELAMRVDAIAQAADQAFNVSYRPKAFMLHGSAPLVLGTGTTGSQLSGFWNTVDWNTSGGRLPSGSTWGQDPAEPPSWWLIGSNIMLSTTSGTASTSTHFSLYQVASTVDPVTGQGSFVYANGTPSGSGRYTGFRLNVESQSGGEQLSIATVIPLYQGTVATLVNVYTPAAGDTANRSVLANSSFWGVRLGKVFE